MRIFLTDEPMPLVPCKAVNCKSVTNYIVTHQYTVGFVRRQKLKKEEK